MVLDAASFSCLARQRLAYCELVNRFGLTASGMPYPIANIAVQHPRVPNLLYSAMYAILCLSFGLARTLIHRDMVVLVKPVSSCSSVLERAAQLLQTLAL